MVDDGRRSSIVFRLAAHLCVAFEMCMFEFAIENMRMMKDSDVCWWRESFGRAVASRGARLLFAFSIPGDEPSLGSGGQGQIGQSARAEERRRSHQMLKDETNRSCKNEMGRDEAKGIALRL